MTYRSSIIILMCYYGEFPWYFAYFLHSCRMNPAIDFVIFSDIEHAFNLPPNVKIIDKSLVAIKQLASEKLGLNVSLDYPYKLCDFKPAYGFIFKEYIQGYDFWGHGDIDVVYGTIREFVTDDLLDAHDLVSVRHDFLTGYFLLFRNNEQMNTLFMQSKDYQQVFTSSMHYCFDETNFAHDEMLLEDKKFEEVETDIESMMHVIKKLEHEQQLKVYWDTHIMEGIGGHLKWVNGKLLYKQRWELLLYHLIHFNQINPPSRIKPLNNLPLTAFNISATRFYNLKYQ